MAERQVAVITGATSGIGRWIALGLARSGMLVVLVARDGGRAGATQRWISDQVADAATEQVVADLSSLAQARAAGEHILASHPRLALLVNNAGLFSPRRVVTSEGYELTLAVNHLAPFVLTRVLEPGLRAGAPARVVNVGSAASDRARLDLGDLEAVPSFSTMRAYGRSKLAMMMASFEWARRLNETGVTVNVVHPGVVATKIAQVRGVAGVFWTLGMPFMLSPERGADTPLYVALAPELAGVTGKYLKRRAEASPNPQALDPASVAWLWAETERLVAHALASAA